MLEEPTLSGGAEGDRTPDLRIANAALLLLLTNGLDRGCSQGESSRVLYPSIWLNPTRAYLYVLTSQRRHKKKLARRLNFHFLARLRCRTPFRHGAT